VRTKDSRGATVLHFAVNTGNVELVQMLLRKGADPNAAASFGTPLKVASDRRRPDIVHLLQQYGAR
jgi:ankyrin repeat protein